MTDHEGQQGSILKELSDIKSSLAVNTAETQNIKLSISEIKADVKEIKNDSVNQRQLNDSVKIIQDQVDLLKKVVYSALGITLATVLASILYNLTLK